MKQTERALYERVFLESYEENRPDFKMNVWGFILGLVLTVTGYALGSDSIWFPLVVLGIALLGWFGRAAYIAAGINESIRKRDSEQRKSTMIQLIDRDYEGLVEARNAMAAALRHLADVSDAVSRPGDDAKPEHVEHVTDKDLAEAVAAARGLLERYGEHQAFVVL